MNAGTLAKAHHPAHTSEPADAMDVLRRGNPAVSDANSNPVVLEVTSVVTDIAPPANTVTGGDDGTACHWVLDMESRMDSGPQKDMSESEDVLLLSMRTCWARHWNEHGSILGGGHSLW